MEGSGRHEGGVMEGSGRHEGGVMEVCVYSADILIYKYL
jgi:hypothetical protein